MKQQKTDLSRREFFKWGAMTGILASVVTLLSGRMVLAEEGRRKKDSGTGSAGGGDKLCDPNGGMAKGMNYQHQHSDVKDAKLKTDRQGLKFDQQFCRNCSFYVKKSTINGKEAGTCQVLQGCLVAADGWCSTWNKKA